MTDDLTDRGLGWIESPPVDWSRMFLEERFWSRVTKGPGCWEWTGTANSAGYGSIRDRNQRRQATAVSLFIHMGAYPEPGLFVCHKCDNPRCVRPDHLFVGTALDNTRDMDAKGRSRRPALPGESNPRARLRSSDVASIRNLLANGASVRSTARRYGVTPAHIRLVRDGVVWKAGVAA